MYDEISANKRNSLILVFLFFLLIGALAWVFGEINGSGSFGFIIGMVFLIIYVPLQYFIGDRFILSVSGARPATKQENAFLVNSVDALSLAAGIPAPKVFVIDDTALNAFATGRDPKHATIVVTTGLLGKLNRVELEGVLAHEMSHIKNYDICFMLLVITLVGAVTLLSDMLFRSFIFGKNDDNKSGGAVLIALVFMIIAPIIATLMQLAVSRQREYLADASGALLTRYPEGLASALEKIKSDKEPIVEVANRTTASLFISNPLRGRESFVNNLFSTHPSLDERIKRLRSM